MSDSQIARLRTWCHAYPPKAADEIASLRAQLSAARAEAEQARAKAIEECAAIADSYTGQPVDIQHPHDWAKHGERMSAIRIFNHIRAISTATTPKGEE